MCGARHGDDLLESSRTRAHPRSNRQLHPRSWKSYLNVRRVRCADNATVREGRVGLPKQHHLFASPRSRGVGTLCVARWLPPLGDCGSVASCHLATVERTEGRRPQNRPGDSQGAGSKLPGWQPKEEAVQLPQKRGTLETAWVASVHKREGAQRPRCEKQTEWRRGAFWPSTKLLRQLRLCNRNHDCAESEVPGQSRLPWGWGVALDRFYSSRSGTFYMRVRWISWSTGTSFH